MLDRSQRWTVILVVATVGTLAAFLILAALGFYVSWKRVAEAEPTDPLHYAGSCGAAMARLRAKDTLSAPKLRPGNELPVIVDVGPPAIIDCKATRDGRSAVYRIRILCPDVLNIGCVELVGGGDG